MDTETLVTMAQEGDEGAFYNLIKENKIKLYKIAYSYLKNEEDSLEAIQETTYRAYKQIKKIKEPRYFNTWLIRILINYCIDELKRKERWLPITEEPKGQDSINCNKLELDMAIDKLEDRYKQVIILRYFEDLTVKDIAEVFDCPQGTVKTWIHKAMAELRKVMGEDGALDGR